MAVFFSSGRPANDGIGAVGFSSVRRIAAFGSFSPMSVRSGPGPSLPLCPILWHARQPDCATTSFPASYSSATSTSIWFGEPAGRWFAFDMSVPDAVVTLRGDLPAFTRHSDVEPHPVLYAESAGVWLDDFAGGWLTEQHVARHLAAGKRVAVVSPELHRRDHAAAWARWRGWGVWRDPDVLLCTDLPTDAEEAFA
jgi:hypothetical protein